MIEKITTMLAQLPPNWMSRVTARAGQTGSPESEMRKLFGDPLPKPVNPNDLSPELRALFAAYGMLEKIKKKLEWISRRKGGKIIPAKNTVACVDEDDNIYMGVGFLEKYHEDEDLIAGIMAHEWGHMLSELPPGTDLSHLNWDQVHALRRDEEAAADAFAGRALFQMGYEINKMISFLDKIDRVDRKTKSQKYHSAKVRAEILRQAFAAQKNAVDQINKIFGDRVDIINPSTSRLIAVA